MLWLWNSAYMNAFHIFSSAPFYEKNPGKELCIDKTEVYCMVISALRWREKNGSISMITDKPGQHLFEKLGVTKIWNSIDCSLSDDIDGLDPTMFWAGAKLLALQNFTAPCVMLDTDFIVWDKLSFGESVIAAHEEELNPDIYPDISHFKMRNYTFPDGLDYTLKALNTAFLYIPDEDFKQYYTAQSIAFMKSAVRSGDYLTYMVFAEQRLLPMLCKKCGVHYTTLMDFQRLFFPQNNYTHLWGAKQVMRDDSEKCNRFCEKCRERIRRSYPEYYDLTEKIEKYFYSI